LTVSYGLLGRLREPGRTRLLLHLVQQHRVDETAAEGSRRVQLHPSSARHNESFGLGRLARIGSATPELRQTFEEWLGQIQDEILQAVEAGGPSDVGSLAQRFKLSTESVQFILFRLARQGKIDLSAGTARAK
jgi:hypothetical protein